jgi:four helix bundle protein
MDGGGWIGEDKRRSKMGERISSFRELRVYQAAFEMQQQVFAVSKGFPTEEKYSLTDQIRRASRSVGANIAEAWQKRRYPAHFTSKLTDSNSELSETQHWIDTSLACKYISADSRDDIDQKCEEIGKMLGHMIAHPEKFFA